MVVWICFRNQQRKNSIEGSEHENKRKMSKREVKIKMGMG
jgi:hypothetical protein